MYSITCIQRPLKGSNESGLLQQVVLKCRFYLVDLRVAVSEQLSLTAGGLLIQVVSNTGLTVLTKLSWHKFWLQRSFKIDADITNGDPLGGCKSIQTFR